MSKSRDCFLDGLLRATDCRGTKGSLPSVNSHEWTQTSAHNMNNSDANDRLR